MDISFQEQLDKLNNEQRKAVENIDGAYLVLAGPGTGKTQLLSLRAANILKKADISPDNILCLTFTEAGCEEMSSRLERMAGKEGQKINVFTFHGLAGMIRNQYPKYFNGGVTFHHLDKLKQLEIIDEVIKSLEGDSILKQFDKQTGFYVHRDSLIQRFNEIKKSTYTPSEIREVIKDNLREANIIESLFIDIIAKRYQDYEKPAKENYYRAFSNALDKLKNEIPEHEVIKNIPNITRTFITELEEVIDEASEDNYSVKYINNFKKKWFNEKECSLRKSSELFLQVLDCYEKYSEILEEKGYYTFDDMIRDAIHAIENNPDLKYDLLERFQFIMVDEFQDTSVAQLRFIYSLVDDNSLDGDPNILAVGDDDQGIYSFQGADSSNMKDFIKHFKSPKIITLKENYRSSQSILDKSYEVIKDSSNNRMEKEHDDISKNLTASGINKDYPDIFSFIAYPNKETEYLKIAEDIKKRINDGTSPNSIAIISRKHSELNEVLPYLVNKKIKTNYKRSKNVFSNEIVKLIYNLSLITEYLVKDINSLADPLISKELFNPAWSYDTENILAILKNSNKNRTNILKELEKSLEYERFLKYLKNLQVAWIKELPLEQFIDILLGSRANLEEQKEDIKINFDQKGTAPYFNYYFSEENLKNNPGGYIDYLEAIRKIRDSVKSYENKNYVTIQNFVDYYKKAQSLNLNDNLSTEENIGKNISDMINLTTAHGAKGLEYDIVYILNANNKTWDETKSTPNKLNFYPDNLHLSQKDAEGEEVRLFYVAMTRAKKELIICNSSVDKETAALPGFLVDLSWSNNYKIAPELNSTELITIEENKWDEPILKLPEETLKDFLKERLENFSLNATSFTNLIIANPYDKDPGWNFMLNSLLHFPFAPTPITEYGTAVHSVFEWIINNQESGEYPSLNRIWERVNSLIDDSIMSSKEKELYKEQAKNKLEKIFSNLEDYLDHDFVTEYDLSKEKIIFDGQKISGRLDAIKIDKKQKTIEIIDYKTGTGFEEFPKRINANTKQLKYLFQLLFYRLLVENSSEFKDYKVTTGRMIFVEESKGMITVPSINYDEYEDLYELTKTLVNKISKLIKSLKIRDLPTNNGYIVLKTINDQINFIEKYDI